MSNTTLAARGCTMGRLITIRCHRRRHAKCTHFWPPVQLHGEISSPASTYPGGSKRKSGQQRRCTRSSLGNRGNDCPETAEHNLLLYVLDHSVTKSVLSRLSRTMPIITAVRSLRELRDNTTTAAGSPSNSGQGHAAVPVTSRPTPSKQ